MPVLAEEADQRALLEPAGQAGPVVGAEAAHDGVAAGRVAQHDRYFRVIDSVAGDQADPAVNGSGVVLDGADRPERGYEPPEEVRHSDGLLTPPSTFMALRAGYRPVLHPTLAAFAAGAAPS